MANICTTQIRVHSNANTIDWFETEVKQLSDSVASEQGHLNFIDRFGVSGDTITDKIGTKWLIFDPTMVEKTHDDSYSEVFIQIETAWTPPSTLITNMYKIVQEKDKELNPDSHWVSTHGRYWDEAFQPIGVFAVYDEEGFLVDEEYLDVDLDEEFYWDTYVEPAFDNLDV